jgi:hypothetical protein
MARPHFATATPRLPPARTQPPLCAPWRNSAISTPPPWTLRPLPSAARRVRMAGPTAGTQAPAAHPRCRRCRSSSRGWPSRLRTGSLASRGRALPCCAPWMVYLGRRPGWRDWIREGWPCSRGRLRCRASCWRRPHHLVTPAAAGDVPPRAAPTGQRSLKFTHGACTLWRLGQARPTASALSGLRSCTTPACFWRLGCAAQLSPLGGIRRRRGAPPCWRSSARRGRLPSGGRRSLPRSATCGRCFGGGWTVWGASLTRRVSKLHVASVP